MPRISRARFNAEVSAVADILRVGPKTAREIAEIQGVSRSTAHARIKELKKTHKIRESTERRSLVGPLSVVFSLVVPEASSNA